jgi:hypothetical protein
MLFVVASSCAAPSTQHYALRQAIIAWDMLAKVETICHSGIAVIPRLAELDIVARQHVRISAKTLHAQLAKEMPAVLMTAAQGLRVVANVGGCGTPAFAQWQGRAAWVVDTLRQVLAGQAELDRQWPGAPALTAPLTITVLGQQHDPQYGPSTLLFLSNPNPSVMRVALLETQVFVGLCTLLQAVGIPRTQGYVATKWLQLAAHAVAPVRLVPHSSCPILPRVNVGGAVLVDSGGATRYWRFLLRGVGQAPALSGLPQQPEFR